MKHFTPKPLIINCDGLSKKAIAELADELALYFFNIDIFGDTISAALPVSHDHYNKAWLIFDKLNLNVT